MNDARIFRLSELTRMENPCKKHLLTPLAETTTAAERRYNFAQISGQNTIERCFADFSIFSLGCACDWHRCTSSGRVLFCTISLWTWWRNHSASYIGCLYYLLVIGLYYIDAHEEPHRIPSRILGPHGWPKPCWDTDIAQLGWEHHGMGQVD